MMDLKPAVRELERRRAQAVYAFTGALACVLLSTPAGAQQWPPERLKNLKVFPESIPIRALVDTMAGFTRALGVRCTFCHVGSENVGLEAYDFASDSLPTKRKAREMIRMVTAINGTYLAKLDGRRAPPIVVNCITCHRGISQPRTLQQTLLIAYDAAGIDSTEATYRALRQRYYGRSTYDFGEVPLADVAAAVRAKGQLADAIRLYKLNIEMSPRSGFALRQAANAELAAGDTTGAMTALEHALVLNPNDTQAKDALASLRRKP